MTAALFTLLIHYCTDQGCDTKPLGQWDTHQQCADQAAILHAMVPGDYITECTDAQHT